MAFIELIQSAVTKKKFFGPSEITMLFHKDVEHALMHRKVEGQYQGNCNCCMQVIAFSSEAPMWCCSDPKLLVRLFNRRPELVKCGGTPKEIIIKRRQGQTKPSNHQVRHQS